MFLRKIILTEFIKQVGLIGSIIFHCGEIPPYTEEIYKHSFVDIVKTYLSFNHVEIGPSFHGGVHNKINENN